MTRLSYFFKRVDLQASPVKEIGMMVLVSYLSYLTAELLHLSGIISLFVCGILMGHYVYLNLSQMSRMATGVSFEAIGYLFEAFVFAYLGLSVVSIRLTSDTFLYVLLLLPASLLGRLLAVYLLPLLYWAIGRDYPLRPKELLVCLYSGLIRGAIAFALSLQIVSEKDSTIVSIVLLMVLLTMSLLGSFLGLFFKKLDLRPKVRGPASLYGQIVEQQPSEELRESQVQKIWLEFEEKYVMPLFKREEPLSYRPES